MKKPASSRKSPTKNAIEPGSALEPEEADATVAEPTGTEAAESQEEIANQNTKLLALESGASEPDPKAKAKAKATSKGKAQAKFNPKKKATLKSTPASKTKTKTNTNPLQTKRKDNKRRF